MNKAWIALSLAPAVVLVGCASKPEPVAAVPPPNYSAEPEPLPPVSINRGTAVAPGDTGATPYEQPNVQPEPLTPVQPVTRTYTIRKGDTFWAIALREYGNGQKWQDIAQANPSADPKKLVIGSQIVLP